MNKLVYIFKEAIPKKIRALKMHRKVKKLQNTNFSIISSNCIGGVVCKDFKQQQRSPTVNCFFYPKDFLNFLKRIPYYLANDMKDATYNSTYPIGKIDDIYIHFLHYNSFKEAKEKWDERKERINFDNLFIIMTDRDGCTYDDMVVFDSLPYKNKILFSKNDYPELQSVIYIKHFKGPYYNSFKNIIGDRYYDSFDFLQWFNSGF